MITLVRGSMDFDALNLPAWEIEHGASSAAEMLKGSEIWHAVIDGQAVMTYGLEFEFGQKIVAWVTVAVGALPGFDLTAGVMPEIEKQVAGADIIAVRTMRAGLVKKLTGQGFSTSYLMTKALK